MNTSIMKTKKFLALVAILVSVASVSTVKAAGWLPDSVGIENRVDKTVVLHKVKPNETIYSILRYYKCTLKDYQDENPNETEEIRVDELVRVPISQRFTNKEDKKLAKAEVLAPKAVGKSLATWDDDEDVKPSKQPVKSEKPVAVKPAPVKTEPAATSTATTATKHTVEPSQTLFSISKKYGVSVDDIKRWNGLTSNTVKVGQALIVGASDKSTTEAVKTTPAKSVPAEPALLKPDATKSVAKSEPKKADSTKLKETKKIAEMPGKSATDSESTTAPVVVYRQVKENGMAGLINVDDRSGKYLALHRSAPAGTLIQVRNEANNRSVFVKVIGKLPDTGLNDKLVIKVSPSAFDKLSPVDRKFRAELSYMKAETIMGSATTASNK